MCLKEVSKKNEKWLSYAVYLTKDLDEAKDLVQDMYIKIHDVQKDIDDFYIIATIRNLFLNKIKQKNKTSRLDFDIVEEPVYEINDEDLYLLNRFDKLKFYEKILIKENLDKSLRDIAKDYNVNYMFVYRKIKEARNKVLNG